MSRHRLFWFGVTLLMVLTTGLAWAQAGRFSVQFDATPLSSVLDALKRFDANLQFSLPPDLGARKVTASLVDVTVDEALQVVLGQANLTSVKDNGVYVVREKPNAGAGRGDRVVPRLSAPVFINRPAAPGEGTGGGGAAAGAGTTPAGGAKPATGETAKTPPLRLIIVKYADPADLAFLFGGDVIQGNSTATGGIGGTGGGGYGGSGGGYGNDGGGYGNTGGGYGNNGRSGSSRNTGNSGDRGSSRSSRSSRNTNNY